ncbi:T9SS type A sorting domain-containing protein [Flavobacterium sp. 25HG05S-40]|uniref:T9SS type A sorting domain-containing protein n=1 Tax=Flavobacterium sp. 25HG05S-40 TaxID=3458682 RepID=UPI0040450AEC
MKRLLLFSVLITGLSASSQSVIQSVNSGSVISPSSSVSVGEIVVVPENQTQSSSGIIGILTQTQLEVPELELSDKITVYPNPSTSVIYFQTEVNLGDEKISIFNVSGQLVAQKQITSDNALDLSELSNGIYLIQFTNKNVKSFKIIKR